MDPKDNFNPKDYLTPEDLAPESEFDIIIKSLFRGNYEPLAQALRNGLSIYQRERLLSSIHTILFKVQVRNLDLLQVVLLNVLEEEAADIANLLFKEKIPSLLETEVREDFQIAKDIVTIVLEAMRERNWVAPEIYDYTKKAIISGSNPICGKVYRLLRNIPEEEIFPILTRYEKTPKLETSLYFFSPIFRLLFENNMEECFSYIASEEKDYLDFFFRNYIIKMAYQILLLTDEPGYFNALIDIFPWEIANFFETKDLDYTDLHKIAYFPDVFDYILERKAIPANVMKNNYSRFFQVTRDVFSRFKFLAYFSQERELVLSFYELLREAGTPQVANDYLRRLENIVDVENIYLMFTEVMVEETEEIVPELAEKWKIQHSSGFSRERPLKVYSNLVDVRPSRGQGNNIGDIFDFY